MLVTVTNIELCYKETILFGAFLAFNRHCKTITVGSVFENKVRERVSRRNQCYFEKKYLEDGKGWKHVMEFKL